MTTADCVDKAINAPDLICPLCGKSMTEWIVGDNPVHMCTKCNVLSFDLESLELLNRMKETDETNDEIAESCPYLEGNLRHLIKKDLHVYHCTGTNRIFAVDPSADLENMILNREDCRLQSEKLMKLGEAYDRILSRMTE